MDCFNVWWFYSDSEHKSLTVLSSHLSFSDRRFRDSGDSCQSRQRHSRSVTLVTHVQGVSVTVSNHVILCQL